MKLARTRRTPPSASRSASEDALRLSTVTAHGTSASSRHDDEKRPYHVHYDEGDKKRRHPHTRRPTSSRVSSTAPSHIEKAPLFNGYRCARQVLAVVLQRVCSGSAQ